MTDKLAAFYKRYLAGIDAAKLCKTMAGCAAATYTTFSATMHMTPVRAGIVTAIAMVPVLFAYLVIPKTDQALADNLAAELVSHNANAAGLAAKMTNILPVDGQTAALAISCVTTTAEVVPVPEQVALIAPVQVDAKAAIIESSTVNTHAITLPAPHPRND